MDPFTWVAIAVVSVLSAARITRLATVDTFPPVRWLRDKYADKTDGSDWQDLVYCGYCFGVWAAAAVLLTGYFSDWHPAWWIVNGILALGYAAAIVMAFDGDSGDDDQSTPMPDFVRYMSGGNA